MTYYYLYFVSGTGDFLPEVVTGIAIAKENDPLSLYFGCMSQYSNMGGAGFITLNTDWTKGKIYPLVDRHRKILAGNMFLTSACEDMPLRENDLQSDEGSKEEKQPQLIERSDNEQKERESVQSVKGSAAKIFSLMQIILTIVFCIAITF